MTDTPLGPSPIQNREHGKVRTDLWCHACGNDFSAALDYDLTGNHVVHCPHCGHEHYRVIVDGVVTDVRWRSSAGPAYVYSTTGSTVGAVWLMPVATGTSTTIPTGGIYLRQAWVRTTIS